MSVQLFSKTKKYVLTYLGCDAEDEDAPKPAPRAPVKPVGKLKVFNNWAKLAALVGLMCYFIYLLIAIVAAFVEDQLDPPLQVTQKPGARGTGEPFFPALGVCATGFNRTIDLMDVGYALVGNASSDSHCYPEPGVDNCDPDFPTDQSMFWKFSIRHEDPNRRLLAAGQALRRQQAMFPGGMPLGRGLQDEENLDELPSSNGDFDVHCIAVDVNTLPGFKSVRGDSRARQLMMLFSYERAPADGDQVQTMGLNGLDVFFFAKADHLPGHSTQDRTLGSFTNLFNAPELVSVYRFFANADDATVLGSDTMNLMTIFQSKHTPFGGPTTTKYNPQMISAPLNKFNFVNQYSPGLNDTNDSLDNTLVTIQYGSPVVTYYENTPPEFATFLGSVGGLKSILVDFWSLALLVLASINQMQAYNKRAGAPGNTAVAIGKEDPESGAKKNQVTVAVHEGE